MGLNSALEIRMADAAPAGDRGGFRGGFGDKGREGLDPCYQAWPSCKGWEDQEFGGNLPIFSPYQRARDHRHVHWACPQRRGVEDHARTEADQSWSEDQVQGIRCYWRLQRPGLGVKCSKEVATAIRGAIILAK